MTQLSNLEKTFRLPLGYVSRDVPEYHNDEEVLSTGRVWQPEIYLLAAIFVRNRGLETVLDIGSGNGLKLADIAASRRIGVDSGHNLEFCREHHPWGEWIEQDLEKPDYDLLMSFIGPKTLVICADVIEHLRNPEPLVTLWRRAYRAGAVVITSTPDRVINRGQAHLGPPTNPAHVREWRLDEYTAFLTDCGLPVTAAGLTVDNDIDQVLSTIITVHDGAAPQPADRPARVELRFTELRPWIQSLDSTGGLIHDINSLMRAGVHEPKPATLGAAKSVTYSSLGKSETGLATTMDATAGGPHAPASTLNAMFEKMLLLAADCATANARVSATQRELDVLNSTVIRLTAELEKARALAHDLDVRQATLATIEKERDEASSALRALQDTQALLEVTAQSELASLRAKLEATEADLQACQAQIASIERERDEASAALRTLQDTQALLEVAAQAELASLRAKLEASEADLQACQAQIATLTEDRPQLEALVATLRTGGEMERAKASRDVERLEEANAQLLARATTAEQDMQSAVGLSRRLTAEVQTQATQLSAHAQTIAALKDEAANQASAAKALLADNARLERELSAAKTALQAPQDDANALRNEIDRLTALAAETARRNMLQIDEIANLKVVVEKQKAALEDAARDLQNASSSHAPVDVPAATQGPSEAVIYDLKTERNDLAEKVARQQAELKRLEARLAHYAGQPIPWRVVRVLRRVRRFVPQPLIGIASRLIRKL